jgi:6-pyruvoyl-tetrahydropterin synthase
MFALEVRDHIMIAHSFKGAIFGPAQAVHGATFVIDAAFFTRDLDAHGLVVDIGRASDVLKEILQPLNYRNLDSEPVFAGRNTTTEFLCRHVWEKLAEAARADRLGRAGADIAKIRVTLGESHVARAWYEAALA